jgi:hypothetical protein
MGNSGHRQGPYAVPAEQWFPVILIQASFSATLQVASLSQWFPRHLETDENEYPRDACFFKVGRFSLSNLQPETPGQVIGWTASPPWRWPRMGVYLFEELPC